MNLFLTTLPLANNTFRLLHCLKNYLNFFFNLIFYLLIPCLSPLKCKLHEVRDLAYFVLLPALRAVAHAFPGPLSQSLKEEKGLMLLVLPSFHRIPSVHQHGSWLAMGTQRKIISPPTREDLNSGSAIKSFDRPCILASTVKRNMNWDYVHDPLKSSSWVKSEPQKHVLPYSTNAELCHLWD